MDISGHVGKCCVCAELVPLDYLIIVNDPLMSRSYAVCEMCHVILWHSCNGDNSLICKELQLMKARQNKKQTPKTSGELQDKARKYSEKIRLEDVAELAWLLVYDQKGFFKQLEAQNGS